MMNTKGSSRLHLEIMIVSIVVINPPSRPPRHAEPLHGHQQLVPQQQLL